MVEYCEICGKPVEKRELKTVFIEGSLLKVCNECYSKIMVRKPSTTPLGIIPKPAQSQDIVPRTFSRRSSVTTSRTLSSITQSRPRTRPITRINAERLELVEDYAERIRSARERLGWSQKVLAEKVRVSENIIKRIESGRLRPTIDLARKLEEVLGIKLLVPAVDLELSETGRKRQGRTYVTLGEIISVRKSEE